MEQFIGVCFCVVSIVLIVLAVIKTKKAEKCPSCNKDFKTEQGLKFHQSYKKNYICNRALRLKTRSRYVAKRLKTKCSPWFRFRKSSKATLYRKHNKGSPFTASHKQTCLNVFQCFIDKGYSVPNARKEAARMLGIHVHKIREFVKEISLYGKLSSNKCLLKQKADMFEKLTSFQKCGIQRAVHEEFRLVKVHKMHPYVTIKRLHNKLKNDASMPKMSTSTLAKVLQLMGFKYQTLDESRNAMLLEKDEIVQWRKK